MNSGDFQLFQVSGVVLSALPAARAVGKKHVKVEPMDIRLMKEWIEENRSETTPFDIVVEGKTQGNDPKEWEHIVYPWFEAGSTWWIEAIWSKQTGEIRSELYLKRIRHGPPSPEN